MPISKQTVSFLPSDNITAFFDTASVTVNTGFYILKNIRFLKINIII